MSQMRPSCATAVPPFARLLYINVIAQVGCSGGRDSAISYGNPVKKGQMLPGQPGNLAGRLYAGTVLQPADGRDGLFIVYIVA